MFAASVIILSRSFNQFQRSSRYNTGPYGAGEEHQPSSRSDTVDYGLGLEHDCSVGKMDQHPTVGLMLLTCFAFSGNRR